MVQQPSPGTSPDPATPVKFRWDLQLTVRGFKEATSYVNPTSEQLGLGILEGTADILDSGFYQALTLPSSSIPFEPKNLDNSY